MISKLLATTALVTLVASAAYAQDTKTSTPTTPPALESMAPVVETEGELVTNIVGENVYNGTGDDAQKIGDVTDIVLSKDGKAKQLVIGVGGFLGIGTKDVVVDYEAADWAKKDSDRWLVVKATKDQLTDLPAFDRKAYSLTSATVANGETPTESAPAVTDQSAQAPAANDSSNTNVTQTTATDKSTLTEVPAGKISADNLIGTTVYGADDASVGKIGDVVLSKDKGIDAIVIDVGGFLGMGTKPVAIGMEKLKFMADKDGNQYLYTNLTEDQLDAQAAYDKDSYVENRDKQRLVVQ